jgi:hypothetical protein
MATTSPVASGVRENTATNTIQIETTTYPRRRGGGSVSVAAERKSSGEKQRCKHPHCRKRNPNQEMEWGGRFRSMELWENAELLLLDRLCPVCKDGEIIDAIRICARCAFEAESKAEEWAERDRQRQLRLPPDQRPPSIQELSRKWEQFLRAHPQRSSSPTMGGGQTSIPGMREE